MFLRHISSQVPATMTALPHRHLSSSSQAPACLSLAPQICSERCSLTFLDRSAVSRSHLKAEQLKHGLLKKTGQRARWRIVILWYLILFMLESLLLHAEGIRCKECPSPHQGTALIVFPPSRWQPSPEDSLEHKPACSTCWLGGNVSSVVCVLWNKIQISKGHSTAIRSDYLLKGDAFHHPAQNPFGASSCQPQNKRFLQGPS